MKRETVYSCGDEAVRAEIRLTDGEFESPLIVRVQRDKEELYHGFVEGEIDDPAYYVVWSATLIGIEIHASTVDLTYRVER